MDLTLYESDLKPEHQKDNTSTIKFHKLNEKAQAAVRAVGRGLFVRNPGTDQGTHEAIYPPKGG
jgi:hypothetical protein